MMEPVPAIRNNINNLTCQQCRKQFKNAVTLKIHLRKSCNANEPNKGQGQKQHQCSHCGLQYSQKSGLLRHIKERHVEYNGRPWICEICGKGWKERRNLTQHLRSKSHGGKGFTVSQARMQQIQFRRSLQEAATELAKPGVLPQVCELCGKGFNDKGGLRQHKRSKIHGGRGFKLSQARLQQQKNKKSLSTSKDSTE